MSKQDHGKKINDEISDGYIQSIKNLDDFHPKNKWGRLLAEKLALAFAKRAYIEKNDREGLLSLGYTNADIDKIGRPRGKPKKTLYRDKDIVQLVYKQNLQAGVTFTNSGGKDMNECFAIVAENIGLNVNTIVEHYKKVPKVERKKIKEGLEADLRKGGALHNRE